LKGFLAEFHEEQERKRREDRDEEGAVFVPMIPT
jgi:hypothetical protein